MIVKQLHKENESKKAKELERKCEEQAKIIEDYTNSLKRLQADFENYIKRVEKEKENINQAANYGLLLEIIKITDHFEEAVKSIKEENEFSKGIKMIYSQLQGLLQKNHVVAIESIGRKLNPHEHDAIKNQESDEEEGTVLAEIQKGYLFYGRVLRPSKVIISNGKKEEAKNHNSEVIQNE